MTRWIAPALLALLVAACTQQPMRTGSGGTQLNAPLPANSGGASQGARTTVEQNPDNVGGSAGR